MENRVIALLVGEVGAGKTTVCEGVAELAGRRGCRVGGILSQPHYSIRGGKSALLATDLWTGESRLLASLEHNLDGPRRGAHSFDAGTFAWARQAVRSALAEAVELVILDEVGPLELAARDGFAPLLGVLAGAPCASLLVVRRAWRAALEACLPTPPLAFEVDAAARDALPEAIVDALWPASGQVRPQRLPGKQ